MFFGAWENNYFLEVGSPLRLFFVFIIGPYSRHISLVLVQIRSEPNLTKLNRIVSNEINLTKLDETGSKRIKSEQELLRSNWIIRDQTW